MMRGRNPLRPLLQQLLLQPTASSPITSSPSSSRVHSWDIPSIQGSTPNAQINETSTSSNFFLHSHSLVIIPTRYSYSSATTTAAFSSSHSHNDADDDGWEDEDDELQLEAESQIGDGGDGGGVVLREVEWGERALAVAQEVLQLHFSEDFRVFAFKTSPRGYIYVRLDKLSNKYGCPSMEEIENFSCLYKKQLDEIGERGEMPDDLALEVSSPGAERILKVPDDLDRFKDMPMQVRYMEVDTESKNCQQQEGVFMLESLETESEHCVWKLADVKENRDESAKGRPLSRKQKDWRKRLPYEQLKRVTLYLDLS
ncbi:hypothetical protein AAC387_Pa05g3595 [Persea americana]